MSLKEWSIVFENAIHTANHRYFRYFAVKEYSFDSKTNEIKLILASDEDVATLKYTIKNRGKDILKGRTLESECVFGENPYKSPPPTKEELEINLLFDEVNLTIYRLLADFSKKVTSYQDDDKQSPIYSSDEVQGYIDDIENELDKRKMLIEKYCPGESDEFFTSRIRTDSQLIRSVFDKNAETKNGDEWADILTEIGKIHVRYRDQADFLEEIIAETKAEIEALEEG